MPNRLANESSPYLRQHENNPVDWYPWGEEAFAKAKAEGKPIFLSVGYSSCHWCHVMEHESFEDAEIATMLNEGFVSIKVDREERPDVDEVYMLAVQLGSGRGGWPMSVFLTPDREPFFTGTYFPREDKPFTARDEQGQPQRYMQPGFGTILTSIAAQWKADRRKLEDIGKQFAEALKESREKDAPGTFRKWDWSLLEESVRSLMGDFDPKFGGFGQAPKFPPHSSLDLLMMVPLLEPLPMEVREGALGSSLFTLRNIALRGLRDHVGGGFHRYSTDAEWRLPHFEKMLYDNALLLSAFVRGADLCQQLEPRWAQLFLESANGIITWAMTEMRSPEGLFYSAIDADSEGEEGKFYTWTAAELKELLGERYGAFSLNYGIEEQGNFEDEATRQKTGANIPFLVSELMTDPGSDLEILRQARAKRVRPSLDDKCLVSWNGLMIGALAEAGILPVAEQAANAILDAEASLGWLPHQVVKGKPSGLAFLEDYAGLIEGLLRLAQARAYMEANQERLAQTGLMDQLPPASRNWREEAKRLLDHAVAKFYDEAKGGFFGTSTDHEELFGRAKPIFDQPVPSANSYLLGALVEFGDEARARQTVGAFLGMIERAPGACEALILHAIPLLPEPEAPAGQEIAPPATAAEVRVEFSPREAVAGPDGIAHATLRFDIPEGLHLNGNVVPARWLIATDAKASPIKAEIAWPSGDSYEGTLEVPVKLFLPAGSSAEEFELDVKFQACTDSECFEPIEKRFSGVVLRG